MNAAPHSTLDEPEIVEVPDAKEAAAARRRALRKSPKYRAKEQERRNRPEVKARMQKRRLQKRVAALEEKLAKLKADL